MEFKSLKNIESSFKQIRIFGIVYLCMCAFITVFSVIKAYQFADKVRQTVYIIDQGKSIIAALAQDAASARPVEAREHVKRFHELFFTLAPDRAAIESNIKRAMFLVDKSAYSYYQDLQEKGYYNRIISGNINQTIQVDSVVCNLDKHPYQTITYARQMIIRASNITERSLITRCELRSSVKSDNNPQGFMIEKFEIIENRDVRTLAR